MPNFVTNIGEEWFVEHDTSTFTVKVGLYRDAGDSLGDTSTLSDITTEPTGSSYSRQSTGISTLQISGDFGWDNDSNLVFDVSDSSETVDHVFLVVSFQSDTVAGDGSAVDHLVAVAALSQSRDLSGLSQLTISAGDLQATAD